jgi:hypothetical protein
MRASPDLSPVPTGNGPCRVTGQPFDPGYAPATECYANTGDSPYCLARSADGGDPVCCVEIGQDGKTVYTCQPLIPTGTPPVGNGYCTVGRQCVSGICGADHACQ